MQNVCLEQIIYLNVERGSLFYREQLWCDMNGNEKKRWNQN
jgi:hypothetical protein